MNPALLLVLAAAASADDIDPPTLQHDPLSTAPRQTELRVTADISDPSGIFGAVVLWRLAGETSYTSIDMKEESAGRFVALIAASKVTADLEYYVEAFDSNGNGPTRAGTPAAPLRARLVEALPAFDPGAVVEPERGGGLPIGPLLVAGAGVVAAAVGAGLWFGASSTVADIDAKYQPGQPRLPVDGAATSSAIGTSRVGSVLMIAGGAAVAGGAAWFFLAPTPDDNGGAGLTVGASGSF